MHPTVHAASPYAWSCEPTRKRRSERPGSPQPSSSAASGSAHGCRGRRAGARPAPAPDGAPALRRAPHARRDVRARDQDARNAARPHDRGPGAGRARSARRASAEDPPRPYAAVVSVRVRRSRTRFAPAAARDAAPARPQSPGASSAARPGDRRAAPRRARPVHERRRRVARGVVRDRSAHRAVTSRPALAGSTAAASAAVDRTRRPSRSPARFPSSDAAVPRRPHAGAHASRSHRHRRSCRRRSAPRRSGSAPGHRVPWTVQRCPGGYHPDVCHLVWS